MHSLTRRSHWGIAAALATTLSMTAGPTEALIPDGQGVVVTVDMNAPDGLPLTPADRLHYCSAFEEASRLVWEATNGSHLYHTAAIFYNVDPVATVDVFWNRGENCTPTGGSVVSMCDYKHTCAKEYVVNPSTGQLDATVYCRRPELTCQLSPDCFDGTTTCPDYGRIRGSRCVDSAGAEVLREPLELGWVLAHEFGHSVYKQPDEYISDVDADVLARNFGVCAGFDDSNGTEFTSIMGFWGRTHFCDGNTHVTSRFVRSPSPSDDVLVDAFGNPFSHATDFIPGGAWGQLLMGRGGLGTIPSDVLQAHPLSYDSNTAYSAVPPYPAGSFSCNWHFASGQGPTQDALVLVDKSGSMSYRHPLISGGPNAVDSATQAAVSFHNQALSDRMVGIASFDVAFNEVDPYGPRGPDLGPITLTPGGLTDLCKAIRDGADLIRDRYVANGATEPQGLQLLLSDARPTTATCNADSDVLDAVLYACQATPGRISVVTSPVGFGDADHDLLRQVAQACNGQASALLTESVPQGGGMGPIPMTTPFNVQVGLSVAGAAARGLKEVAGREFRISGVNEESFLITPGTKELVVEFVGDGFVYNGIVAPDAPGSTTRCNFGELTFELESPSGVIVSGNRPIAGESAYLVHTAHVDGPAEGNWVARVIPSSAYECLADSTGPRPWGEHDPRVYVLASARNDRVRAELRVPDPRVGRNGAVIVEAELWSDVDARLTGIQVRANLRYRAYNSQITLRDDGLAGDVLADDGVYYGAFNAAGATLQPGEYVIETELVANDATSTQFLVGDPIVDASQPSVLPGIDATLKARSSVSVEDCSETFGATDQCRIDRAVPRDRAVTHPCLLSLEPGSSYSGLRMTTEGLAMGSDPVQVYAGLDITISNVSHTYDGTTGNGEVTFDASVAPWAAPNPREVVVTYAGRSISTSACLGNDPAPGVSATCLTNPSAATCCDPGMNLHQGNGWPNLILASFPPNPDCIFGEASYDLLYASSGDDFVSGGSHDDKIYTYGGDDAVLAGVGHDLVITESGNDTIFGQDGHDILTAGSGHDWLVGGPLDDVLTGGSGDDRIDGGGDHDALTGGDGNDWLRPGPGLDIVEAGGGDDQVVLYHPCEYLLGKTLIGDVGNDTLVLPTTLLQALASGMIIVGFEQVVENDLKNASNSECAP